MTPDTLLKMTAIVNRMRCGVPVILMGECGCGKTMLLRYLCAWLTVDLEILDVHGGTTEADILDAFRRAERRAGKGRRRGGRGDKIGENNNNGGGDDDDDDDDDDGNAEGRRRRRGGGGGGGGGMQHFGRAFLFLDEMNARLHTALIEEAICHRTLHGRPIHDGVHILAAANPYRRRKRSNGQIGNESAKRRKRRNGRAGRFDVPRGQRQWRDGGGGGGGDRGRSGVQRTHAAILQEFVFDFGALAASEEAKYVSAMVAARFPTKGKKEIKAAAALISAAQKFVREAEGDSSAVSLRDVKRCVDLVRFFIFATNPRGAGGRASGSSSSGGGSGGGGGKKGNDSGGGGGGGGGVVGGKSAREIVNEAPLASPLVLALAHIYLFRLSEASLRQGLWQQLRAALQTVRGASSVGARFQPPARLPRSDDRGQVPGDVAGAKRKICKKFALEPGIALNDALMENLYVVVICILNLIPVFVVGKPGSSKTLAMQVIVSNLQGEQSVRPFWRHFPAVALFRSSARP